MVWNYKDNWLKKTNPCKKNKFSNHKKIITRLLLLYKNIPVIFWSFRGGTISNKLILQGRQNKKFHFLVQFNVLPLAGKRRLQGCNIKIMKILVMKIWICKWWHNNTGMSWLKSRKPCKVIKNTPKRRIKNAEMR